MEHMFYIPFSVQLALQLIGWVLQQRKHYKIINIESKLTIINYTGWVTNEISSNRYINTKVGNLPNLLHCGTVRGECNPKI